MNELALLVHLVVVLAHPVLLVDSVDKRGITRRLMIASPRVVQGQQREFRHFDPVMTRVIQQTVSVCHCMDLRSLHFQVLQPFVQINIALDTPDVCWLTCVGGRVLHHHGLVESRVFRWLL